MWRKLWSAKLVSGNPTVASGRMGGTYRLGFLEAYHRGGSSSQVGSLHCYTFLFLNLHFLK